MVPNWTRAERSQLNVEMCRALGTPLSRSTSRHDLMKQAVAEAVAWANTGDLPDLGTIFSLAEAIDVRVFEVAGGEAVHIDATELRERYGNATVSLALRIAGYDPARKFRVGDHVVRLPGDLLSEWYSDG